MNTTSTPDLHRSGERPPRHPGRRGVPVAPLSTAVVVVALAAADHVVGLRPNAFDDEITGPGYLLSFVLSWWAWVPVTAILLMEWWAPAERPERARRVGIAADLLWAALQIMVWTPLVLVMLRGLSALFEGPLSMLRLDVSDVLPTPVLVIVGFALGDLIRWYVHFQFHRHDRLWRIHQVHHTQDHMSMWTDFRSHPVEIAARSWPWRCRSSSRGRVLDADRRPGIRLPVVLRLLPRQHRLEPGATSLDRRHLPNRTGFTTPPIRHISTRTSATSSPSGIASSAPPAPTPRSTRRRGSVTPRCPWNTSSPWPTRLTPTWRSSHIPSAESGTTIGLSVASATTSTPTESDSPWDGPRITTRTPRSPS